MEDLRRIIARRKDREEEEDRISQLPDEVIHHILSFVDVDLAVQTSVLSKRWVNLWFTLTHLNFEKLARDTDVDYYLKFVTNLLLKRNQLSDTSTIRIDCRHNELISGMILDYAACHNVKHFNISSAHIGRKLSFPLLETLHLSACQPQPPLMKWSVPSLKSLHLGGVIFDRRRFHFEKFSNLDNLCLSTCFTFGMDKFVINSPSVTCLNISNISEMYSSRRNHFVINAPKISCFRLSARGVPVLSATNGFPCLKEADFDITIDKDSLENYTSEDIKEIVLKFISLFREFGGIKFLTLTFETILVLSKILDHIRCLPSPFVKLKSLNLRGYVFGAKNPTKYTNNVINYLLTSSPGAKIFVQDSQRQFRSYNPSDDILFKGNRGFYVVRSKENMALRQPATSNIHVNGDVMNSVLGVIPSATVHSEVNDQTCSDSKDDSFSLWEGHLVYLEYVDLLTYIKKEHPETFEHFAPQTDFINTLGLNTLCSSVRALSEVSGASFNTSTITRYKGVFTDLEKWGFNTTWLLNLLPSTDEIQ